MSDPHLPTFTQTVESALKIYTKPKQLAENSPLASPWFLGSRLPIESVSAEERGGAVQQLLSEAAAQIVGKNAERHRQILEAYYFNNQSVEEARTNVGLSKNAFHLNRNAAITALEDAITNLVQPAFHLEDLPHPKPLFGREAQVEQIYARIQNGENVAILGLSGIGKSALAVHCVKMLKAPIFWFTLRPGLNDQAESLLFALALFAHRHGSSSLWLELMASRQYRINEQLLSALRYTLEQLPTMPLLCFDELEHLQPTVLAEHHQFVQLLDSLRSLTSSLYNGQQVPVHADEFVTLGGLPVSAISEIAREQTVTLSEEFISKLSQFTGGNPRLIELVLSQLSKDSTTTAIESLLLTSPTTDLLLQRILEQISQDEMDLLLRLCVFRNPVPVPQNWLSGNLAGALSRLLDRGLVQQRISGTVEVPSAYRQLVYNTIPDDARQQLHYIAATLRSESGAYTAAAHHLIQAGQTVAALTLWRDHGEQEITQGQAVAALTLFQQVASHPLFSTANEQVTLICAQLEQLTGREAEANQRLSMSRLRTPSLAVEADELVGQIANDRSEFGQAEAAFERALKVTEKLIEVRQSQVHKGKAWMYLRQRELQQAEKELNYAHFEVENMRGNLALDRAEYGDAQKHFNAALALALDLDRPESIAKSANNLAIAHHIQGELDPAHQHLTQAYTAYEQIGKINAMAGCRMTLAVIHNQSGKHSQALASLDEAESLLTSRGQLAPWQQGLIEQARAEANLGLGNLDKADEHVQAAIATEEISLLPDAYRVYGEICLERGQLEEAETFLKQSLNLARQNEDRFFEAYALRTLSRVYKKQGERQKMADTQQKALDLFEELGLDHEIEKTEQPS